jgi:hypothetical protein
LLRNKLRKKSGVVADLTALVFASKAPLCVAAISYFESEPSAGFSSETAFGVSEPASSVPLVEGAGSVFFVSEQPAVTKKENASKTHKLIRLIVFI